MVNRPIKFRAWVKTKDMSQMFSQEAGKFEVAPTGNMFWVINLFRYNQREFCLLDFTPMQYTGLKDKNSKEIYEGDIIKITELDSEGIVEYTTPVIFQDCAFFVRSGGEDYDTFLTAWVGSGITSYPQFEIEVIGNIYENPDLLEKHVI